MSRASDLRDAIVSELSAVLLVPVSPMVVIDWSLEELQQRGPLVGVRTERREFTIDMGPDQRGVDIGVLVLGAAPQQEGYDHQPDAYRQTQLKTTDGYDAIVEQAIALWTPDGPLSQKYLAEHRYNNLTQETAFDPTHYQENGIWIGPFTLTYIDSKDEES